MVIFHSYVTNYQRVSTLLSSLHIAYHRIPAASPKSSRLVAANGCASADIAACNVLSRAAGYPPWARGEIPRQQRHFALRQCWFGGHPFTQDPKYGEENWDNATQHVVFHVKFLWIYVVVFSNVWKENNKHLKSNQEQHATGKFCSGMVPGFRFPECHHVRIQNGILIKTYVPTYAWLIIQIIHYPNHSLWELASGKSI